MEEGDPEIESKIFLEVASKLIEDFPNIVLILPWTLNKKQSLYDHFINFYLQ